MALKAGDLYVNVTANIGEFSKSMKKVADDIAKVAAKIESFGAKIGAIGTVLSAGMAGALLASAQWSSETQAQLDRVKQTFLTFAAEIGDALLPFLRQFGDRLQTLLGMWQGLSPRLKTIIVDTIAYGAAIGVAGGAVGKLAGVVGGMAQLFSSIGIPAIKAMSSGLLSFASFASSALPSIGSIATGIGGAFSAVGSSLASIGSAVLAVGAPILAVAAVVVAFVALAGTLYHVWKDNSEAIKAALASAWASVKGFLSQISNGFVSILQGVGSFFKSFITTILDGFALLIRSQAQMMETVAKTLHLDGLAKMLEPLTQVTGKAMADGIFDGLSDVAGSIKNTLTDAGSSLGESISYGAKYSFDGVKAMGSDVADYLKGKFGSLFNGGKGTVRGSPITADRFDVGGPDMGDFTTDFLAPLQRSQGSDVAEALEAMRQKHLADLNDLQTQLAPEKQLAQHMGLVNELYGKGRITASAYYGQLIDYLDQTNQGFALIHEAATTLASDLTSGFVDMANGVKGAFGSMVTSILADFERLAANKAISALLNLGLNAVAGLFGGVGDPTGQNYTVGGSDIMTAVRGIGDLRAPSSTVHATTSFVINIHTDGTATTDAQGGTAQMQQMAKGLKAVVERHLQEQMRPGGTIYNFARAR